MQVGVSYAEGEQQVWVRIEVGEDATVREAIEASGVLQRFPKIDLATQKVGIFGKVTKLDTQLQEGDRVEIYRAIIVDPKTVPRRRRGEDDDAD
jgi:hypothetical protein